MKNIYTSFIFLFCLFSFAQNIPVTDYFNGQGDNSSSTADSKFECRWTINKQSTEGSVSVFNNKLKIISGSGAYTGVSVEGQADLSNQNFIMTINYSNFSASNKENSWIGLNTKFGEKNVSIHRYKLHGSNSYRAIIDGSEETQFTSNLSGSLSIEYIDGIVHLYYGNVSLHSAPVSSPITSFQIVSVSNDTNNQTSVNIDSFVVSPDPNFLCTTCPDYPVRLEEPPCDPVTLIRPAWQDLDGNCYDEKSCTLCEDEPMEEEPECIDGIRRAYRDLQGNCHEEESCVNHCEGLEPQENPPECIDGIRSAWMDTQGVCYPEESCCEIQEPSCINGVREAWIDCEGNEYDRELCEAEEGSCGNSEDIPSAIKCILELIQSFLMNSSFDLNYDVSALPVLPDFSISIFGNSINVPLSLNWNEKNKYKTVRTLISVIRGFLIFFVTYKFFLLIFHEIKDLK